MDCRPGMASATWHPEWTQPGVTASTLGKVGREGRKLGPCDIADQLTPACPPPFPHSSSLEIAKPLTDEAKLVQDLCYQS